jgi:hypothetical protein
LSQPLLLSRSAHEARRGCEVSGCKRRRDYAKWCRPHQHRWYRYGSPTGAPLSKPTKSTCAYPACTIQANLGDYCGVHYRKVYNKSANGKLLYLKRILKSYGLTLEDYINLLKAHNYRCAICQDTEPGGQGRWQIDHDHSCCPYGKACRNCVRGILCQRCNSALGLFRDDPARLAAAITYLICWPTKNGASFAVA